MDVGVDDRFIDAAAKQLRVNDSASQVDVPRFFRNSKFDSKVGGARGRLPGYEIVIVIIIVL